MKIIQLSDALSNKIAAGEVVERPASVVKELVENSIDAKSTWIRVDLSEAGLKQIKVTDNGDGMSEEDCEKAFLRHATSKIKKETDLFHVRTLGFRGEALASISAVSKLTIQTSQGDAASTKLSLEGGKIINKTKGDARKGTEIAVNQLFYNTPARLKYMKTIYTELGHITDLLNRLALANPSIRFESTHNGRELFKTSGSGDLLQVISNVYGMNVAKKMLPVSAQTLDFEIEGFIAKPELTRASRNYISTIINGRYIRSYPLIKAINRAYHTLLPIHRFPFVVLSIQMDPILVDVNVHPTKLEVRFSKEKELFAAIEEMIRNKFRSTSLIPEIEHEEKIVTETVQSEMKFSQPKQEKRPISTYEGNKTTNTIQLNRERDENKIIKERKDSAEDKQEANDPVPSMYPIGQLHGTYILAQNERGLYMIDQHAAQERIKYELFLQKLGEPESDAQELLLPITFEFSKQEALFINQYKQDLQDIGLSFEDFGRHTYAIRSHPTWFPAGFEEEVIREIIDYIMIHDKINIADIREEAAILMACKRSIKANYYLNKDDMFRLLEDLRMTTDPFTCPHGRPVIVHITSSELEKMFKRVM